MTRLYAALAFLAGIIAMIAKAFAMGKKSAKQSAELTKAKSEVRAHETRNEVERDIASGGDAVGGMRDKWGRK